MAEKKSKGKTASEKGVMASLPSTRPTRIGGRRRGGGPANPAAPAGGTSATATKASAKPKPAAAKTRAKPKPAAAKPKPAAAKTSAKPKPAAAKPKPAAAKPKPAAAKAKPAAAPKPPVLKAVQDVSEPAKPKRPRPVRAGSPGLAQATEAAEERAAAPKSSSPSGSEIVSTAIQAAGELAQIGLTVGGQILKRAVERIPKP